MRIVQGRGIPRVIVPPERESEVRRRRLRWAARIVTLLLLGDAIAITVRAVLHLQAADESVLDVLLAWHWDYVLVPLMVLGFLVTLRRERLGGVLLVASTLVWLFLRHGGNVPDVVLLFVALGVIAGGGAFIWLGNDRR
jgi:hypothetical protein